MESTGIIWPKYLSTHYIVTVFILACLLIYSAFLATKVRQQDILRGSELSASQSYTLQ